MAETLVRFSPNTQWPVTLEFAKNYLKINPLNTLDDALLQSVLIPAATCYVENATGLILASRQFVQCRDSFPFYPYSREPYGTLYGVGALSLYFGYGPVVPTPFPPYGLNSQDRMPFQIDLLANPVSNIDHIDYVDQQGNPAQLLPNSEQFDADILSIPGRVLPPTGGVWPQCTIGANNVRIYFTAGLQYYDPLASPPDEIPYATENVGSPPTPPDTLLGQTRLNALPQDLLVAILMALSNFYFNRDAVVSGNVVRLPHGLDDIVGMNKVYDFSLGLR